ARFAEDAPAARVQVVAGLGGIGKTQVAVEYAYRHRERYPQVFWVPAATEAELRAGFVEIARVLDLPEKDDKEQEKAVQAARRWLGQNGGWLLVFDNADTPALLGPYRPLTPPPLPRGRGGGARGPAATSWCPGGRTTSAPGASSGRWRWTS